MPLASASSGSQSLRPRCRDSHSREGPSYLLLDSGGDTPISASLLTGLVLCLSLVLL